MGKARNPFIDDGIVTKDDYCSRTELEQKIKVKLHNGHNLVLIGDRRIGKTSTAHYVIDGLSKVHKIDIDIYHIRDVADLAKAIIDACLKVLEKVWDFKKFQDYLSRLTPQFEINESGLSLGVGTKNNDPKINLTGAFLILEETIKRSNHNIVVLFDEFQAILELKDGDSILKFMRGKIQKISRVPFMYVGSIRHEMDHIFRDQSSPFYKQADIIYFDHIDADNFYDFIFERFKKKKIILHREVYDYLYSICYGVTGDIQTFCRVAYDYLQPERELRFDEFFEVLEIIYKNEKKYFEKIIDGKELTKVQSNLIVELAGITDDVKIFGREFQQAIGVKSPGAINNAIDALEKKELIYKVDDKICFSNPFFKEWILDNRFVIKASVGVMSVGGSNGVTRLDLGFRERLIRQQKLGRNNDT